MKKNIINREEQVDDKDETEVNLNNEKQTDYENSENVKIDNKEIEKSDVVFDVQIGNKEIEKSGIVSDNEEKNINTNNPLNKSVKESGTEDKNIGKEELDEGFKKIDVKCDDMKVLMNKSKNRDMNEENKVDENVKENSDDVYIIRSKTVHKIK